MKQLADFFDPQCLACGVAVGVEHEEMCDIAVCLHTGEQRWVCEREDSYEPHSDCGNQKHDGYWHGIPEAIKSNVWSKWIDGAGWAITDGDDPEASPSLNDVYRFWVWDSEEKQLITNERARQKRVGK